MALHNPFDLQQILVVDLAGNPEVFSFVAMLLIAVGLSRFNFSNKINLVLFALATVIMATYMAGIYVLVIILASFATFHALTKIGR